MKHHYIDRIPMKYPSTDTNYVIKLHLTICNINNVRVKKYPGVHQYGILMINQDTYQENINMQNQTVQQPVQSLSNIQ